MVPKAWLFMITQITGMSSTKAVARAAGFWPKPQSTRATTTRSGMASLTPSAAGEPKPMVANPPGVKMVPGS